MKRYILIDYRGDRPQRAMAEKYKVSQQAYAMWENGENTPTPDKMRKIAEDIGRPMEEIFFDAFYKQNNRQERCASEED